MALFAMIVFGFALLRSMPSDRSDSDARNEMKLRVDDMSPGEVRRIDWQGRQLILLRRTPGMLSALPAARSQLRDPDSTVSRQPPTASNSGRSLYPELFVALGYGTGMGCPLDFVRPEEKVGVEAWSGGFRDRCDGSLFDTAGRVYKDQPATINLVVPPYRQAGADHIQLESRY